MEKYIAYPAVVLLSYLLGSSSMALYLSKLRHVDIRSGGSRNLGTSNAAILLGWPEAVLVGVHDIGKAILAVYLAQLLFPEMPHIGVCAGVACVLGHIFPFYLRFRGGKGFASFIGALLVLDWRLSLGMLLLVVLITLLTDYLVLGTASFVIISPIVLSFLQKSITAGLILFLASAVILLRHTENFRHICAGTEIGFRSTVRGTHRVR